MSQAYKLYIHKSNIKHPSTEEINNAKLAQKFAIGIYDKKESRQYLPEDWHLIAQYSNDNGFHGEAYEKNGKVIIVFRGTEFSKPSDLYTDYRMVQKEIDKKVSGGEVYVHSYTKDDGTHVRDYRRSYPNK